MNARQHAVEVLKKHRYAHVVYGFVFEGKREETGWENEMLKFRTDKDFEDYVKTVSEDCKGFLDQILAVHAI